MQFEEKNTKWVIVFGLWSRKSSISSKYTSIFLVYLITVLMKSRPAIEYKYLESEHQLSQTDRASSGSVDYSKVS